MTPISLAPLTPVTLPGPVPPHSAAAASGFGAAVGAALQHLNAVTATAAQTVAGGLTGQTTVTQAMVATIQAQTSLDVAASIRNALLQGTQTLLNLQI